MTKRNIIQIINIISSILNNAYCRKDSFVILYTTLNKKPTTPYITVFQYIKKLNMLISPYRTQPGNSGLN